MRRSLVLAVLLVLAVAPARAGAVVPEAEVGGASSKWISGSLLSQPGENCSVLGSPYTEIMVSGIASYGGVNGVPTVGDRYYAALLLSVPGNPCGPGSSGIVTDLMLPRGTTIDTSAPIRCFGQPRNASTFGELTGGSWSAFGSSGPYCPASATPSAYTPGAWSIGYRPIASGQLFQVFVPVKSTQQLTGAAAAPADEFAWYTNATGVYANPGRSAVWANVFPAGAGGSSPFVYFAGPAALPFWKADAPVGPPDLRNRAEFFANVYTAGLAGNLSYVINRLDTMAKVIGSADDGGWNGSVAAGQSLVQILPDPAVKGPTGGYAPWAFDYPAEWNVPMRITWTFAYSGGQSLKSADFTTLAGPDTDGDGVADAADACVGVKGTLPDGCLPALVPDPDQDGVYGTADLCPSIAGQGALNGCPGGIVPAATTPPATGTPAPTVTPLSGALGVKRGGTLKRRTLLRGLRVRATCSRDAAATATLAVSRKVAKTLKLKATGTRTTLATGRGSCRAAGGVTLRLKLGAAAKRALGRARRPFAATLTLRLAPASGAAVTTATPVRVG